MTDTGAERVEARGSGAGPGLRYELFILALTLYALVIMGLLLLPLEPSTMRLLQTYDNLICCVFLVDLAVRLRGSHPRREYLIHERGWLDLLGSIPSLGFLRFTALFRLFRVSRLLRIGRLLRQRQRGVLVEVLANRGQYAAFVTVLAALAVLTVSSVLVLEFEAHAPDANITSAGDAVWWAIVTITTVGYGDQYPVTPLGRLTATFVMITGIGIIGALASILASVLVSSSPPADQRAPDADAAAQPAPATPPPTDAELALLRARIEELQATLRLLVDARSGPAGPVERPAAPPGT